MSPRAHTALAALAAVACLAGGAAVAEAPATRSPDADEAPLAVLTLALAAAPVPQLGEPEPGADAVAQEPRVDLVVTFAARSVAFEQLPRIRMTFGRPGPLRAVWRVERRNLPARVEPGVEYRDVEVRLTLSSTLDEFESLIEDARRLAGGVRVEKPGAPASGNDQPRRPPRVAARPTRMDAINAERARAGLLPRRSSPARPAPGSSQPVSGADALPAAPAAPALSHGERAAPAPARGDVPAAAPGPATAAVAEPAGTVFGLVDVVLAAMRSRSPAGDADARAGSVGADTSLESLGVRVRGALVESLLVGRAGELTVTVQTGSASARETDGVPAAPVPDAVAAADVRPAPPATSAAPVTQPPPAASPRPAAPVVATAPAPPAPSRDEPSRYAEDPGLLSRWRTAHGEIMERTLDSSGIVIERQVDPPDGWQKVIDVSRLTLVSQRRDDDGRIVQVVQDVSGAYIEVTRDPIGRLLQARVLRR